MFEDDVRTVLTKDTISLVDGLCVPKVDRVEDYRIISETLYNVEVENDLSFSTLKVIPQIESTQSMINMKEIFEYDLKHGGKRIVAAAFGGDDFTADFGVFRSDDDRELDFARKMFALTCHSFGITSIDTPYVQFKNQDGLKKEL